MASIKKDNQSRHPTVAQLHSDGWFTANEAAKEAGLSRSRTSMFLGQSSKIDRARKAHLSATGKIVTMMFYREKQPKKKSRVS